MTTPPTFKGTALVPWVELNSKADQDFEAVVRGIEAWRPYCGRLAVSTVSGRKGFYTRLQNRLSSRFPIIPGIKPMLKPNGGLLETLDDEEGWRRIAGEVVEALNETGADTFVLECEMAVLNTFLNNPGFSFTRFTQAISQLPRQVSFQNSPVMREISYWFWPVPSGKLLSKTQTFYRAIMRSVELGLGGAVSFIDFHFGYPGAEETAERRALMSHSLTRPRIPGLYFYGGERFWRAEEARGAILCAGPAARPITIVYGFPRFETAGPAIGQALWP